MPRVLWSDAEAVAQAALDGLAANRRVVVPGVTLRALLAMGRFVPRGPWGRVLASAVAGTGK